jgi:two-component system sensor histidine kinase QseC
VATILQEYQRRVLVLIDKDRREALGRDFAWHIVQPAMVLLPLVALLLLWAIRRGLQPLEQLAAEVAQLDLDAGDTLQSQQPFAELSGTVKAINSLAQRLQAQVLRERSFASDVAHELRTPLTAQVLQARLAREQCSNEQRDAALQQVEQNALRAGRILAQLMDLTRAQALDQQTPQRLDLNAMCHQLVAEHVPLAHQLGHDLALDVPAEPVWVHGHGLMLELALRNLIDNAHATHIVWDPGGGLRVKRLGGKAVRLSVSDDGETGGHDQPAGSGMGIGLTLVRRIASWHGIAMEQCVGVAPFTKSFTLTWPDAEVMRATGLADPA